MFLESNGGSIKHIFLPEGEKADGWWQMTGALHEVAGVKLELLAKEKKEVVEVKSPNSGCHRG